MSKRNYYNKGRKYYNNYNENYYDKNDYNNNYNNNYNDNDYYNYNNSYYNRDNKNRSNNYNSNNNRKQYYNNYDYNGLSTKRQEKYSNKYGKEDYFTQKFNKEISQNDKILNDEETKIIISPSLKQNGNIIETEKKIIKEEDKNPEKEELVDADLIEYIEKYTKTLDYHEMEKYCEEINKTEVTKAELKYKNSLLDKNINQTDVEKFRPKNYEIFKVVHSLDKKNKPTNIIDFSFNKKGIEENNLYLNNPEYFSFFRRGFSLYKNNNNLIILRKGLIKFLELPYDFFKIYQNNKYELNFNYKDFEENSLEEKTNYQNLLKSIFYPLYKILSQNKKISIYTLLKANGENAQITYNTNLKKWVIASKNVSLICKNSYELYENYEPLHKFNNKPTRYNIAFQIALCWFDILEKKTEDEINLIKKKMDNFTFCGEYCGNQFHEHLIRHINHTIYFYSIVENNSKEVCLPIEETFNIFNELKLDFVRMKFIGTFDNKNNLFDGIHSLYKSIAEKPIQIEEEGDVIYFVDENKKIINLCKIKTLEYKIYRKLREKIKNELLNENGFNMNRKKISQFFNEVQTISQNFNLPNSLEFYFSICDLAFRFIDYYKQKFSGDNPEFNLHTSYLDLIEMIHSIIDDTILFQSKSISNNALTIQDMINNSYNNKKSIQIFIFTPPCYLSDDFFMLIKKKYSNIHFSYKFNSFDDDQKNLVFKQDNLIEIILINYLDENCFNNIDKKIFENQFIIAFGISSKEFESAKEKFSVKLNNPDFFIYNKNSGLFNYFKNKNKEDKINLLFKNFLNQCRKILFDVKKNYPNKIKIYDIYDNNLNENYIADFDKIINDIKTIINSTEYEKNILEQIENNIQSKLNNDNNNSKENENINENNKIETNYIKNIISKKETTEHSKYYNSNIINLYQEHTNPFLNLIKNFISYEESQQKSKNDSLKNAITNNNNISKVIILIPITLPGTGKTELINYLKIYTKKYNVYFEYISSDEIRKKEIEKLMINIPGMTEKEAFMRSRNNYNKSFVEDIENKFKKIYLDNKIKNTLIYIDKNHPPNAINKSIEPIKKIMSDFTNCNKQVLFVGLIPDCINNFKLGENGGLPFSLSYLIQCYVRVRNRKNHPLMNQNRKDLLLFLMGSFIKNFIGVSLDNNKLMTLYSIDKTFKLQFTDEIEDNQFPEDILVPSSYFIGTLVDSKYDSTVATSDSENFENKINKYFFNVDGDVAYDDKNEIKYKLKKNIFYPTKELLSNRVELMIKNFFISEDNINNEIKLKNFIYIAIIFRGQNNCFKIKPKIYKMMKLIKRAYSNLSFEEYKEVDEIASSFQVILNINLPKNWYFPHKLRGNYWHITTLYKGNKSFEEIEDTLPYKQYAEDKKIFVYIIGMVYVPEGIICLLVRLNEGIEIAGNFPHMTIIRNKYPPKYSNNVIKEFMKYKEIKTEYERVMFASNDLNNINTSKEIKDQYFYGEFIKRRQIKIDDNLVWAYFIIFEKPFEVQGFMHAFEKDENNDE